MPAFTQQEFEALIADVGKVIEGDIAWVPDSDHSPSVEFLVEVANAPGYPLVAKGTYNHEAKTLSFALIHRGSGRLYGLDLGKDHRNPSTRQLVGEKHKHRWDVMSRDKEAYVPKDITAPVSDPVAVWGQFCLEAKLTHQGKLKNPVPQRGLFDAG